MGIFGKRVCKWTFNIFQITARDLTHSKSKMFGLGELPKEYNPKVHGPYDPAVYYGARDKKFGEVKLGELPGWLARRNKTPTGMGRAMSRAYWRWCFKYVQPKYCGLAPGIQLIVGWCGLFYLMNYRKYWDHRNYKHQW